MCLGQQVEWGSQVCASSRTTVANCLSLATSAQRVYHPPLQGVDPDTGCDRDDPRAQPAFGPFLPDSPKVVD